MSAIALNESIVRFSGLKADTYRFDLRPDKEMLHTMASDLDLIDLRKVRMTGRLSAEGSSGWRLDAELGATVVQACRVTLAPVTTRIDQFFQRRYLDDLPEIVGEETEMPEDDTVECLPATLDLNEILHEALSLALPDFPRASGAELETGIFAEPGKTPLSDAEAHPFAGLADLGARLKRDQ